MRNLSTVRAGWDEIEAEETRLLRETEDLFRADRTAYLTKLQQRLGQLAESRGEYRVENLVQ